MKANMGSTDRIIRVVIAILFLALYLTNIISGTIGIVLIAVSAIFLITSFVNFCPLYAVLGISTLKKKKGNA